jgi:hypothetical protein
MYGRGSPAPGGSHIHNKLQALSAGLPYKYSLDNESQLPDPRTQVALIIGASTRTIAPSVGPHYVAMPRLTTELAGGTDESLISPSGAIVKLNRSTKVDIS